ncbi:MAG: glycosyltransferase family 2 protein [Bacteroidales bacterium]|nr:glycosyltransferase family 2 protein [Bacteroidales bacterium]
MADILYITVPCYNEEEVLNETASRLIDKLTTLINTNKISMNSRILFVDDGSKDRTWNMINQLHSTNSLIGGLKLSRNRGHQNALLAGLMEALKHADMVISMDADLQDDIDAVDAMLEQYYQGNDIVYGVRSSREKDTFFKKFTAESFYRIMLKMGVELVFNHADYRLMSKRALEGLMEYEEVNLFLRGIIPQIGYKSAVVQYERNERFAGESKYPVRKMLSFAMDGITSFSVKPMRLIVNIGAAMLLISIIALIYAILSKLQGSTVSGWTSTIVSIWFIGGIQILCLGIIGEYIGKIYSESKKRPRYIIDTILLR